MNAIVYGLASKQTGQIMYVGRTIQPLAMRLHQHIDFARRKRSMCGRARWIRAELAAGFTPDIFEIERMTLEESPAAEGFWIQYFRYVGADLLNEQSENVGGSKSYVVDWTPALCARLGTVSDTDLAAELGIDRKSVEYKRRSLGITRKPQTNFVVPPMGGWNRLKLPDAIIQKLGTVSDERLAQEAGVTKQVIQRARQRHHIANWSASQGDPTKFKAGSPHPRWDIAGKRLQATSALLLRLGKVSDMVLARELGYKSKTPIVNLRQSLGISAWQTHKERG